MRSLLLVPICLAIIGADSSRAQDDFHPALHAEAPSVARRPLFSLHSRRHAHRKVGCDHHGGCNGAHAAVALVAPGAGYADAGMYADAAVLPYRQPILPPPATFYGYFNSPPEHAHLWDTYPQERAWGAASHHVRTHAHH